MKKIAYSVERIAYSSVLLLVASCWLLATNCYAQPVSSTELINKAKEYDGKVVTYEGEAIGDIMRRGDFAWVNVNDGAHAVGIWLEKVLAEAIAYTGSYKSQGDVIEVVGVFNRACPQHGGDLDIHAQTIRKISTGHIRIERTVGQKWLLVGAFLLILCLILILQILQSRRLKK